ncbi:LysR substrate-binding domain-containing protein [Desulfovibrio aminophilus]|uniref:LysR family transcriptional regulator n=1 Tax=Desulfovibrio aminophilus TaxID=81425 RepID=UPI00339A1C8B
MELRDVRTFMAVAQGLSFNRAAEALHTVQSTVSARVANLERELGVRLFERLGRRVALTEAGRRLQEFARKLLDLEDEARSWVAGESEARGTLTIRVPETLCTFRMPGVLRRFRRRFPNVGLFLTTCALEGLDKDLRRGVTDLAFLFADSVAAGDMTVEALGSESLLLVVSPAHRLASLSEVAPDDLRDEPLLVSRVDCSYRRMFERLLKEEGVRCGAGLEFSSVAGLKSCLAGGLGVAVLPETSVRGELAAGRLKALPWSGGDLETAVLMLRHKDKWLSPTLEAFMETAREEWAGTTS